MKEKAGWYTPMLPVADVQRSVRFYEKLGFELIDTEGDPPGWARMHCEGSAVMFLQASSRDRTQGVSFAMYAANLPAMREQLIAEGVACEAIVYPPWMKSGAMNVYDPDGFEITINHWGEAEHSAWLKHLEDRKTSRP